MSRDWKFELLLISCRADVLEIVVNILNLKVTEIKVGVRFKAHFAINLLYLTLVLTSHINFVLKLIN